MSAPFCIEYLARVIIEIENIVLHIRKTLTFTKNWDNIDVCNFGGVER